jgi:hypothetical protein
VTRAFVPPISARTLGWITLAAVLCGCWLRLAWPLEIEYKADEVYMFEHSQRIGMSEPWPVLGMRSGAGGVRNPGLSVWFFAGLARLTGATTPVELSRAVQGLNCLALGALALFARRFTGDERRAWLWALCFAALAPTAILVQRKMWAQSVLPLLCMVLLAAWWRRRTFFGALAWAALALLIGQIHMTGFIFFAALTLWTLAFRRNTMDWRGWAVGTLLGGLTALPWLQAALLDPQHAGKAPRLFHVFNLEYWRLWLTDGIGVGLPKNLGPGWIDLMQRPLWAGHATWLVGAAELGLCAILGFFLLQWAEPLWRARHGWRARLAGLVTTSSESTGLLLAALVGYGLLLSLPTFVFARYYLLITFPLAYLWLARLALSPAVRGRAAQGRRRPGRLALNLFVAVQLLGFLRQNGGAPHGDFGVSWRAQAAARAVPADAR